MGASSGVILMIKPCACSRIDTVEPLIRHSVDRTPMGMPHRGVRL